MPAFKPNKSKSCPCGCGELCTPYFTTGGRFKGYSHHAPTCKTKAQRNNARIAKMKATFAAQGHPNEKPLGSRRLHHSDDMHDYWLIKVTSKGKWVYEHRHIMEQRLGRRLTSSEHVHHQDHDTLNNNPANLQLLTASAHGEHHLAPYRFTRQERWSKKHDACLACHSTAHPHDSRGLCHPCRNLRDRRQQGAVPMGQRPRDLRGRWALAFPACTRCGTTERRHFGKGLCTRCYDRHRNQSVLF